MAKQYSEINAKWQAQNGIVPYYYKEHGQMRKKLLTVAEAKKRGVLPKEQR